MQLFSTLTVRYTTLSLILFTLIREHESMEEDYEDISSSSFQFPYPLLDSNILDSSVFQKRLIRSVDNDLDNNDEEESDPDQEILGNSQKLEKQHVDKTQQECDKLRNSEIGGNNTKFTNDVLLCLLREVSQSNKLKHTDAPRVKTKGDVYLPDDYNKLEVPLINVTVRALNGSLIRLKQPVECQTYLNIRGVRGVDDANQEVTLDMDVILIWVDGKILKKVENETDLRLSNGVLLSPLFLKTIWTPDLYFEEVVSISSPTLMGKSETVVLFPKLGAITYRRRIIAKLNCGMNFFYYPADTQECSFTFKSFSYTTEYLKIDWVNSAVGVYLLEATDPNFDFQVASPTSEELPLALGPHSTAGTTYSTLKFKILSRRKLSYHLVQTYIPSAFFVLVTWLCFMIPSDLFEARIGIAMTTLLTITAMFSSVRESTPTVSYVKAIDIWMVSCILFLFAALTAFTASEWVKRMLKALRGPETIEEGGVELELGNKNIHNKNGRHLWIYEIADCFIENYLSWLLATGFTAFVIAYWSWLLTESGYNDWKVNATYNNLR